MQTVGDPILRSHGAAAYYLRRQPRPQYALGEARWRGDDHQIGRKRAGEYVSDRRLMALYFDMSAHAGRPRSAETAALSSSSRRCRAEPDGDHDFKARRCGAHRPSRHKTDDLEAVITKLFIGTAGPG